MGLSVLDWNCVCCRGQFNPASISVGRGNGYQFHRKVDGRMPVCAHCENHEDDCLSMTEELAAAAYDVSNRLWQGGVENKLFPAEGGPMIAIGDHRKELDYHSFNRARDASNLPSVILIRKDGDWWAVEDGKRRRRLGSVDPAKFVLALCLLGDDGK